jgi:hypothetical protein
MCTLFTLMKLPLVSPLVHCAWREREKNVAFFCRDGGAHGGAIGEPLHQDRARVHVLRDRHHEALVVVLQAVQERLHALGGFRRGRDHAAARGRGGAASGRDGPRLGRAGGGVGVILAAAGVRAHDERAAEGGGGQNSAGGHGACVEPTAGRGGAESLEDWTRGGV